MSRSEVREALEPWGVAAGFNLLPHDAQERVRYASSRWLAVFRTPEFDASPLADEVAARVRAVISAWTVEADTGKRASLRSTAGVFLPFGAEVARLGNYFGVPGITTQFPEFMKAFSDACAGAMHDVRVAVEMIMARFSRIDGWVYGARLTGGHPKPITIELHVLRPERRSFLVDGARRAAWRLTRLDASQPFEWLTWLDPAHATDGQPDRVDVYAQGHLLDRVAERAGVAGFPGLAERWTMAALQDPVLVPFGQGRAVRFRAAGIQAGYVPLAELPRVAVARTLLLNTMRGTPEGDRLHERLRSTGRTAKGLGLDRLDAFVHRNPFDDPVVADALLGAGLAELERLSTIVPVLTERLSDVTLLR